MQALNEAIEAAGGVGAFADLIGVRQSVLSNWRSRKSVAPEGCAAIERVTAGAIACEQLRPDVRWTRVPDARWPHPNGRPLIDVARAHPDAPAIEAAKVG